MQHAFDFLAARGENRASCLGNLQTVDGEVRAREPLDTTGYFEYSPDRKLGFNFMDINFNPFLRFISDTLGEKMFYDSESHPQLFPQGDPAAKLLASFQGSHLSSGKVLVGFPTDFGIRFLWTNQHWAVTGGDSVTEEMLTKGRAFAEYVNTGAIVHSAPLARSAVAAVAAALAVRRHGTGAALLARASAESFLATPAARAPSAHGGTECSRDDSEQPSCLARCRRPA